MVTSGVKKTSVQLACGAAVEASSLGLSCPESHKPHSQVEDSPQRISLIPN